MDIELTELKDFGDRVRELRASLHLSQKEFSEKVGITASALSSYENNIKNPSLLVAYKIAVTFNVSIDWLCGLSETEALNGKMTKVSDVLRSLIDIGDNTTLKIESQNYDCVVIPQNIYVRLFLS